MSKFSQREVIDYLQRSWWIFLLRGIVAIVLGAMAFAWPALMLVALVIMFGVYFFVDGVLGLIEAIRFRDRLQHI